jgi:hypothetical protein
MSRKFLPAYAKEFNGIVAGKDEYHARCTCCNQEIDLSTVGKSLIERHLKTDKHRKNAKTATETQAMSHFFKPKKLPRTVKLQQPKVLGATTLHDTDKHLNQPTAFQALDCSSKCFRIQMWPKNLLALRLRRQQLSQISFYIFAVYYLPILDVLAPHSVDQVLKEVGNLPFSISIDASNHGESKMFPIVIR